MTVRTNLSADFGQNMPPRRPGGDRFDMRLILGSWQRTVARWVADRVAQPGTPAGLAGAVGRVGHHLDILRDLSALRACYRDNLATRDQD